MITVACVYRTGGDFDREYVRRLKDGVERNLTLPHRFACLTDDEGLNVGGLTEIVPLAHDWPGWWAKIELFKLAGPVLYLDLDMVVVGSLDKLVRKIIEQDVAFVMLRGFYRRDQCSGIMGWNGDVSHIYQAFVKAVESGVNWSPMKRAYQGYIAMQTKEGRFRGDQEWLRLYLSTNGMPVVFVQDLVDGIYSYKAHVNQGKWLPSQARIVCFHGRPRPHEVGPVPDWLNTHFWNFDRGKHESTHADKP